jgi:uracil-DNA glycosylase
MRAAGDPPSSGEIDACRRCELWEEATRGVAGEGASGARIYFQLRGKRRIHKTPLQRHVAACHDWLEGELAQVDPIVIVTLGATALAAVLGRRLPIAEARDVSCSCRRARRSSQPITHRPFFAPRMKRPAPGYVRRCWPISNAPPGWVGAMADLLSALR